MFFTPFLEPFITAAVLLIPLVRVNGYTALYTLEDTTATFCYDYGYETTGDRCAGRGSSIGPLSSVPHCVSNGPTYNDLATNRIVAMNRTLMEGDLSAWCGKERTVQNWCMTNRLFCGMFVLWDVCEASESAPIIDMGVDAYLRMMDGDCMHNNGNNPTGLTIKIIDNQIWAPAPGTDSYSPIPASTLYSGGGINGVNFTNTVIPPWGNTGAATNAVKVVSATTTSIVVATSKPGFGTTSIAAVAAATISVSSSSISVATAVSSTSSSTNTGASCSKGEYKCDGGSLYECNYLSNSVNGLGWAVQASCPGGCNTAFTPICTAAKKRSRERV